MRRSSRKRKINPVFWAGLVTLLALVVSVGYVFSRLSDSHPPDIVLPAPPEASGLGSAPPPSDGAAVTTNTPTLPPSAPVPVDISLDNAKQIVEALFRPAQYQAEWQVEWFWGTGSGAAKRQVFVRDGYTKTEVYDTTGALRENHITGDGRSFIWSPGSAYWQSVESAFTPDSVGALPTFENILTLADEDLLTAEYELRDGVLPCIRLSCRVPGSQYIDIYWLSLDDGLPVLMEREADGETAFRCTRLWLDLTAPTDDVFRLPDNRLAMEVPLP
ncbi:MAG: hypothetical protein LBT60_02175 [Oscillospiraceae bacterium]|jgi:hypothetical protein|nr:hypothetical protein [Oscillospiraceae bacterium]